MLSLFNFFKSPFSPDALKVIESCHLLAIAQQLYAKMSQQIKAGEKPFMVVSSDTVDVEMQRLDKNLSLSQSLTIDALKRQLGQSYEYLGAQGLCGIAERAFHLILDLLNQKHGLKPDEDGGLGQQKFHLVLPTSNTFKRWIQDAEGKEELKKSVKVSLCENRVEVSETASVIFLPDVLFEDFQEGRLTWKDVQRYWVKVEVSAELTLSVASSEVSQPKLKHIQFKRLSREFADLIWDAGLEQPSNDVKAEIFVTGFYAVRGLLNYSQRKCDGFQKVDGFENILKKVRENPRSLAALVMAEFAKLIPNWYSCEHAPSQAQSFLFGHAKRSFPPRGSLPHAECMKHPSDRYPNCVM